MYVTIYIYRETCGMGGGLELGFGSVDIIVNVVHIVAVGSLHWRREWK